MHSEKAPLYLHTALYGILKSASFFNFLPVEVTSLAASSIERNSFPILATFNAVCATVMFELFLETSLTMVDEIERLLVVSNTVFDLWAITRCTRSQSPSQASNEGLWEKH